MKDRKRRPGNTSLALCILALFVVIPFAAATASAGGLIKVVPDHVELGSVDEGVQATAAVTVENTGDAPLTITNVRTN
ncbi:MAG: hypothetical protein ABSD38_20240 [Syntrophorhabdales bacterium]|jgi:hypothetical protein